MTMYRSTLLIAALSAAFFTPRANAQCINGTASYPIYKDGADIVYMLDTMGKEVVHIEYDLIRDTKEVRRVLSTDWTYTIVAFADDGVKDIDLKLYEWDALREVWVEVASETKTDAVALINYTPSQNQEYKVEVKAYSFHEGYDVARYGLIYYHD